MAAEPSRWSEPDEKTETAPVWPVDPRFRTAVEARLDGLAIYSSVRDERGEIVDFRCEYANAFVTMNGGPPPDEQVGRTMREVFPRVVETGLFASHVRVVETGEPAILDVPWYEEVGATGGFEVRTARIDDGCVVVFRAVTEQRETEATLRASEERLDGVAAVRTMRDGNAALAPAPVSGLAGLAPPSTQARFGLTERELEVVGLLADGVSTKELAERLFISRNTARNHVQRAIRKLGAHSRLEAVAIATRAGLVQTAPP